MLWEAIAKRSARRRALCVLIKKQKGVVEVHDDKEVGANEAKEESKEAKVH